MRHCGFGLTSLAVWLSLAAAEKDDTYLPDGIENPNLDEKMYWRDAYNVLQDINQFDKLYVKFHSCVWSEYYGNDEDGGGGGDESDTWYLNSVPPFRANVAFSLYGVLKGYRDRGCSRKTYINSFYSTGGVESYTNALALAGISDFTYIEDEGGEDNGYYVTTSKCNGGDEHRKLGEDGYASNGAKYEYGAYSYGLACSGDNFVSLEFSGEYCDGNDVVALTDTLESYNEKMQDSGCAEIYNSKTSSYAYGYDDDGVVGSVSLLQQSRACSPSDLSGKCPDPYGKAKQYAKAVECATGSIYCSSFKHTSYVLFFSVGGYMVLLAFFLIIREAILEYIRRRYDDNDTPDIVKSPSKRDRSRKSRKNKEDKVEKARKSSRRKREEKDKTLSKSPSKSRSVSRSLSKSKSRSPSKTRGEYDHIEKSPSSPKSERRKRRSKKEPKSPKSPRSSKSKPESKNMFFSLKVPRDPTSSYDDEIEIKQSRSKSKSEKSHSRRRKRSSRKTADATSPERSLSPRSPERSLSPRSPERHSSPRSPERATSPRSSGHRSPSSPSSASKTKSPRSARKTRSSKSPKKEYATRSRYQHEEQPPVNDSLVRKLRAKMEELEEAASQAPIKSIDIKDGETASSLALPSLLHQEDQDYHKLTPPKGRKDVWASEVVNNAELA